MTQEELLALLRKARTVLQTHLFDEGEMIRDDIAEICMQIDDALPDASRVLLRKAELERDPHRSAA
jgi:hypothetical protein